MRIQTKDLLLAYNLHTFVSLILASVLEVQMAYLDCWQICWCIGMRRMYPCYTKTEPKHWKNVRNWQAPCSWIVIYYCKKNHFLMKIRPTVCMVKSGLDRIFFVKLCHVCFLFCKLILLLSIYLVKWKFDWR